LDRQTGAKHLRERLDDLDRLQSVADPAFEVWKQKTDRMLSAVFGEEHRLLAEFRRILYRPTAGPVSAGVHSAAFTRGQNAARGVLEAAIYEKEELDSYELLHASFVDPELWENVEHLVEGEQWAQVASQTAIFVEDRIREWASRSSEEIGERLMTTVFTPEGDVLPLGNTSGERQGWHRLAMGFAMALRNVDTHRIQSRPDLKRYAFGVLGVGSLLLTQLRYQYGSELSETTEPPTSSEGA
jgi:Protein of unknown function (Hypoth_ymh)